MRIDVCNCLDREDVASLASIVRTKRPLSDPDLFKAFREKMERAEVSPTAILAFERSLADFASGGNRLIPESELLPVGRIVRQEEVAIPSYSDASAGLLDRTVVIKLNGGLGTSMGLQGPKSLLEVRDGQNFLDIIVRQIEFIRRMSGAHVRLLLMNSFSTSEGSLEHLRGAVSEQFANPEEVELMQNQVPKIDARTMQPVEWPGSPELEWCPPGHGDLYTALVGSGWLDRLLAEGREFAFVSNCDNLGAILNPKMLEHFAKSGADFLMEVTRRTESDRKGGHLAERRTDGHLMLRELAQCPEGDLESFQDIEKHRYFNTNSLWLRLGALRELVDREGGFLPLPVIANHKRVDPRDNSSPPVIQLETAMGAAIREFDRSGAVEVPRRRFAPVKTTGDLLALRSDAYQLTSEGRMQLVAERNSIPPHVSLSDDYRMVDSLEALGLPSLRGARSLKVEGLVRFGPGAAIEGEVVISNRSDVPLVVNRLVRDEVISNS